MKDWLVVITAIVCLAGLEAYALHLGINGVLFSGIAVIIGGLAGYKAKTVKDKISKDKGGSKDAD